MGPLVIHGVEKHGMARRSRNSAGVPCGAGEERGCLQGKAAWGEFPEDVRGEQGALGFQPLYFTNPVQH